MSKIKLAVIFGGQSSEYSVSLHSASSAIENMDPSLYDLTFIGIDEEGKWYYYPGDVEGIEHGDWKNHPGNCLQIGDVFYRALCSDMEKEA